MSDSKLDRFLKGSFGIFSGVAKEWAVLRFSAEAARWVAEESWHPDQLGTWKGAVYEPQDPYANPTELVMEILKHGPDAELVAPEQLRLSVAERLTLAADQYC